MTATTATRAAIATAPVPFGRLVRVEIGKATDTRASRWLLGLTALATVGLMPAPLLARHSIDQTTTVYLQFTAFALATLLPVVSILTMTSEWTQRTVLSTFTQEPRRTRVVAAKVSTAVLLALVASAFGMLVAGAALGVAAATGRDLHQDLGVARVVGYVLFILLNILIGVAFGALLHNSAAAIVLFFALPTAFGFLGAAIHGLGDWLDTNTVFNRVLDGRWSGHTAQIAVATLVWIVVPLAAGFVRTVRREIK